MKNFDYITNPAKLLTPEIGDSIGFAGFVKVADEYSGTKAANLAKAWQRIDQTIPNYSQTAVIKPHLL